MPSQGLYEGFWVQTPIAAARRQSEQEADTSPPDSEEEQQEEEESQNEAHDKFDIDMITGYSYTKQADADLKSAKVLQCSCPDFTGLLSEEEIQAQSFVAGPRQCEIRICLFSGV